MKQQIEIDWTTGETRDLAPVIAYLERQVAELQAAMKRGYWYEPALPLTLTATAVQEGELPAAALPQRVLCRVVRERG